ncbi:Glutaredoxin, partial [Globisporangium splendens]
MDARYRYAAEDDQDNAAARVRMPAKSSIGGGFASHRGAKSTGGGGSGWFGPRMVLALLALFGVATVVHIYQFSYGDQYFPPLTEPFYNKSMVEFSTKFGTFTIDLYPEHAPKSVDTFKKLVDQGFYEKDAGFYRNEPNFVLQGGGFLAGKKSPFDNLPVEYSEERMVVIARGRKASSGNSEFAIMLHDNTESNKPTDDSPGYTVFGRVVEGWHTIQSVSKKMRTGYLAKEDLDRQTTFDNVQYVSRVTHNNPQVKARLEELTHVLETEYTVTIFSELNCPETKELRVLFSKLKASARISPIGHSPSHPYEREALEALTGQTTLPQVYVNKQHIGRLADVEALNKDGRLQALLERSGALAEPTVWNAITQYPLVVFSKSYCPYCKKAKEVLAALGAKPYVFELDLRQDGPAIQSFLFKFTHQSTVPNVFIKGKSIGGSDDTLALYKSGELKDKLKRAGAI